ncbi:MAG: hypothetical protein PVJ49_00650, partial [Acidobacteriota bacterium]
DKVLDGVSGYLVTPGDVDELAEALVLAASADGRKMGAAGREHSDACFDWDAVIDRYVDVYHAVRSTFDR